MTAHLGLEGVGGGLDIGQVLGDRFTEVLEHGEDGGVHQLMSLDTNALL